MTQMPQRPLGRGGPSVSAIGLGCMRMSEFYGPADDERSIGTIHRALDLGINFRTPLTRMDLPRTSGSSLEHYGTGAMKLSWRPSSGTSDPKTALSRGSTAGPSTCEKPATRRCCDSA